MAQICMYTASGEAHGLINTMTNSVENNDFKHMAPHVKAKLEKEKKEDSRMVKAEYFNRMGAHERLTKPYCRYAGDPIQIWNFIPGRTYEVPFGLIKEVNDKEMPRRSELVSVDGVEVNEDGKPLKKDQKGEWVHRFISAEFK
jgi:hypothetical protein